MPNPAMPDPQSPAVPDNDLTGQQPSAQGPPIDDAMSEDLQPGQSGEAPSNRGDPSAGETPAIAVEEVMEALSNVIDPELGLDFVELGLVYGVEVDGGDVEITFTLTTPACPIGPHVTEEIEEFVGEVDGVRNVTCKMVFTPAWSPERMSEDAKFALGF